MNLRDRFYKWVHARCLQERGVADALLQLGGQLAALTSAVRVQPRTVATMLVLGRGAEGEPFIYSQSKAMADRSTTLEVETLRPMTGGICICVLADVERVGVQGIFHGANVLTLDSPVALSSQLVAPGERLRAVCFLREVRP